jgi:hypothetical protein
MLPQYIYFGSGEFDGQGSGHDYYGTVSIFSSSCPAISFISICTQDHLLSQTFRSLAMNASMLHFMAIVQQSLSLYFSVIRV